MVSLMGLMGLVGLVCLVGLLGLMGLLGMVGLLGLVGLVSLIGRICFVTSCFRKPVPTPLLRKIPLKIVFTPPLTNSVCVPQFILTFSKFSWDPPVSNEKVFVCHFF